jgi:hypothetical protein
MADTPAPSGSPGAAAGAPGRPGGGALDIPGLQQPGEGGMAPPGGVAPGAGPGPSAGPADPDPAAPAPDGTAPATDGGPEVVPIDAGRDEDLLNPQPGAPGMASRPPGAEATTAGNRPHRDQVEEQSGEQEVSFGGHGDEQQVSLSTQDEGQTEATAAAVSAPAAQAPATAPPERAAPAPRDGGDDRHGEVVLDPQELAELARATGRVAAEYREIATSIRMGETSQHPPDVVDRVRAARLALEQLADELDASGRDLEMRAGMIDELSDIPGVRDADVVSTVFSTKVNPLGDPPSSQRRG